MQSSDVVQTADYEFTEFNSREGDSGVLLLAKHKTNPTIQYLVKHQYTDCACNEYVYTKLAQAMGYCMPDVVLFRLSLGETRRCFKTEYIIGERLLNVQNATPSYSEIREHAENWEQYFAFSGMYAMTMEGDGMEVLLADDQRLYRVDTIDAFPISNFQLDQAGVNCQFGQVGNPSDVIKNRLLSKDFDTDFNPGWCDIALERCLEVDSESLPLFLDSFKRIQSVSDDYIDSFLNTLCYFYPDFIGDFFKRYLSALKKNCAAYYKEKIRD